MSKRAWMLSVFSGLMLAAFGCAHGSDGTDGSGGAGGDAATTGGERLTTATHSSSHAATSGTSTSTTSSGSSVTTASSSSGGMMCAAMQHYCGGICAGNTAQTGCYADPTCTPCTPPMGASPACDASGHCDFTCSAGYMKSGNACVCATQCCVAADCPGSSCVGGVCQATSSAASTSATSTSSGGGCDDASCFIDCVLNGSSAGLCVGGSCLCI